MNRGPFIFLGCFAAMALSWFGMVLGPQLQWGAATPLRIEETNALYPAARPGLAQRGAEVYREQGCNQCHSQQVRQESIAFATRLDGMKDDGDANAVAAALVRFGLVADLKAAGQLIAKAPVVVAENISAERASFLAAKLSDAGAKAVLTFTNLGADLARGWGVRFSAAQDYLYDATVLAGDRRHGPDLANLGVRAPEQYAVSWTFASTNTLDELRAWHFKHLADPRSVSPGSVMPSYKWLFEERGGKLQPTRDAEALVAYLLSLRQDVSLPAAPLPAPPAAPVPATAATNAPAP
jgi:cbb3-type cytochrome oxidase cytochrome c subunit